MKSLMPFQKLREICAAASLLGLMLAAVSCGERNTYVQPPSPDVEVVNALVGDVAVPKEAPGRTRAFARAEIRARVQGFLQPITDFKPGNFVKEGQILYRIERDEFEAALKAAQGQLEAREADFRIADSNAKKRKAASVSGAVSKIDVESAEAERDAAKAAVAIANADLDDATRALSYTELKSPIDGRISQTLVDVGNLVGADGPTLLNTVIQDDPIYVDFEGNERGIIEFLPTRPGEDRADYDERFKSYVVRLKLADGSEYAHTGNLDFIDNEIDSSTGTIAVRAVFKNPDGALTGGMYVRISLDEKVENAIQVPAVAIQRDMGGPYVVVVGADNVAERRPVEETSHQIGDNIVLTAGLTSEDQVIVTNLQRARPGVTVNVVEAAAKSDAKAGEPVKEAADGATTDPKPAPPESPAAGKTAPAPDGAAKP